VFSLSTASLAQDGPPKQLEIYKQWVGKWACENRTLGEGSHAFKATWEMVEEFPNVYTARWLEVESNEHPQPGQFAYLHPFDLGSKRHTCVVQLNTGTQIHWTATGVTNAYPASWVWEAEGFRSPITRHTDRDVSWAFEIKDGDKVTRLTEGRCTKQ
jgi:hypothetical protein